MILKPSQSIRTVVQLFCRSINDQTKKSHVLYRHNHRLKQSSYVCNVHSFRQYATIESGILRNPKLEKETKVPNVVLRGKAASQIQESYIEELVAPNDEVTDDQWTQLLDKISRVEHGLISTHTVDGRIIENCITYNRLKVARSYLKFMRKIGKKFNSATVSGFIQLCYNNRSECTNEDLARVQHFLKYLRAKYTVLDTTIGDSVVKGLCLLNDWQQCATVLDQMMQYMKPLDSSFSAYLLCLFDNNQTEEAYQKTRKFLANKHKLRDEVYIAWINSLRFNPTEINNLLELFRVYDIKPSKTVCDHLISVYSDLPANERLIGSYTSIYSDGACQICREKLQRVFISEEEFTLLRDEFLNKVLIRDDVFQNTTPKELKLFFELVEKQGPFDIVIDGLNVMYMHGTQRSNRTYAKLLTDTVHHFVERGQKVLIIGRKHLYSFSRELLTYIRENSTLFMIDDLSEDDPFMIYATIYSGPDACFVTRDLMRSEKFRLGDDKLELLFKRWQLSHQIFINFVSQATGRLYLKNPVMYDMSAQPSKHGWHVPYLPQMYQGEEQYGVHEYWLCLKR